MVTVSNILADMNATSWRFNGESCNLEMIFQVPRLSSEANASIGCDCNIGNDTDCHVVRMYKLQSPFFFFPIHFL